jgi:mono/diheme cytochrome c family protein
MSKRSPRIGLFLFAGALLLNPAGQPGAEEAAPLPGNYRIVDGKVDWGTYAGWLTYHLSCHMCHGQDATGTDVAPDLRQSLKRLTPQAFADKVLARYRLFGTPAAPDKSLRDSIIDEVLHQRRGERGLLEMPVWLDDPGMKPHVLDLYAYLKARSDGVLGTGTPLAGPLPKGERE